MQQANLYGFPSFHKSLLHLLPGYSQAYFDALAPAQSGSGSVRQTTLPDATGAAAAAAAPKQLLNIATWGVAGARLLCLHIVQRQEIRMKDSVDETITAAAAAGEGQELPELVSGMASIDCLRLVVELQLLTEAMMLLLQQQQELQNQEPYKMQVLLLVASNQLLQQLLQCSATERELRRRLQDLLARQDVVLLLLRALTVPVQPGLCDTVMRAAGSHWSPGHQLLTLRSFLATHGLGESCWCIFQHVWSCLSDNMLGCIVILFQ
jgi:hypothetical protein